MTKYMKTFVIFLLVFSANSFAQGKLSVIEEAVLNVEAETAWAVLGDFNGLPAWLPIMTASELDGTGTDFGDIRILTLGDGGSIIEKLTNYDKQQMEYSYEIMDSPLPLKNYKSTIKVEPVGNQCKFTWTSTFDADGASDEEVVGIITGVYKTGIESLTKMFSPTEEDIEP